MKKILKGISRVLFSLLLIVSIFGTFNVLAEEVIFKITNISVKEKSDKVTVNDVSLSGGQLKNDIVFTEKDDYIKYDITIKNSTTDDYTIKSITDDNTSPYLEYTYDDLSNIKLNAGEEETFELQIKYVQKTNNITISDQAVSLTLTYEKVDGTTGSETITNSDNNGTNTNTTPTSNDEVKGATDNIANPKTGDNVTTYIILGIISLVGLAITTINKKHLSKTLMVITLFGIIAIPFGVNANSSIFKISFTTNKIQRLYTQLISGKDLALKIAELSGYNVEYDESKKAIYDLDEDSKYYNDDVFSIKKASLEEYNNIKTELTNNNIISTPNSIIPSYMWYDDNGTIYYYSELDKIYLNEDCSFMFYNLTLDNIDLSSFDTSNVTNMSYMFNGLLFEDKLDLTTFNTSNVTNMRRMFSENEINEIDLSSFDTSNVIDMNRMFYNSFVLTTLDLSSFNTKNVTDMGYMFYHNDKLKTIYVSSNFIVADNIISNLMFAGDNKLVGGAGTAFDTNHKDIEYARIDDPENGKPGYFTNIADKPQS